MEREQIKDQLAYLIMTGESPYAAADAILREFALRPVSQGVVDSESGEVVG